jgi:hypothetical protein
MTAGPRTTTIAMPSTNDILQLHTVSNHFSTDENSPERDILTLYMLQLQRTTANYACPIISIARRLSKLSVFHAPNFVPSDGVWRAIMLVKARSSDIPSQLTRPRLCDAAWTLREQNIAE